MMNDDRERTYHDKDGIRVEEQFIVVGNRLGSVLTVKSIGSGEVELSSILLGKFDEPLESIRVGIVVICTKSQYSFVMRKHPFLGLG